MAFVASDDSDEDGVFSLITDLCNKTVTRYHFQSKISQKKLVNVMRSRAYEIILKKTLKEMVSSRGEPIADLLSYYFVSKKNARNVAEHKRSVILKKIISTIRQTNFGESKENFYNVLKLLVSLSDTVKEDLASELFQKPFSFGLLDEMLPKPPPEGFGSPEPYSYYPSHVFELPYSLKNDEILIENQRSQTYTEYTVESFDTSPYIPENFFKRCGSAEIKTFLSPMSLQSLTSSQVSPYSGVAVWNLPRLTVPRDLNMNAQEISEAEPKISLPSSNTNINVEEVYRAKTGEDSLDIWEIATQIDKDIPDDIWDIVYKMPEVNERQLISSSPREMALWHVRYDGQMGDLDIVTEKLFIRHIMYLIIGVETKTFPFCEATNSFYMKEDLVLEGISKECLQGYVTDILLIGTYYKRLYKFAFDQTLEDHFHSNGLVFEAVREVIRRYLLDFRMSATEIYDEFCSTGKESLNCVPTLLQILHHLEPLKYEIETVVSVYKLIDPEPKSTLPRGAELMSYLFSEISLVSHQKVAYNMFSSLVSICKIYFKFIEKFIFDGELDDRYNEFFIRKDAQYVNTRSKRYWDKGFHITQSGNIPEFLRSLAKCILLCGKSLRLLKHCNPSDPLVLLISSDHPTIKCCTNFEELGQQQRVLDVYRTRCLFVTGEPMTFQRILLNREAEKKAFTEMASIKQAETMEKIIAERKRLAQLIIAEKQHSLRVLEAAMAETKAARMRARQRERRRCQLQAVAEKAAEEVDASLKEIERDKIMEYYSKLNMEVEKSKIHTEWKMKRLRLDQSRMLLLSTEERNLKREKLELEHQKNEEVMAMSIQSTDSGADIVDANDDGFKPESSVESSDSNTAIKPSEPIDSKTDPLKTKTKSLSTDVISAICNATKSLFSVSYKSDSKCDNEKELDAQGNVVSADSLYNTKNSIKTSNSVIGDGLSNTYDNLQYLKTKEDALKFKQKIMAHEYGRIDIENNQVKDLSKMVQSVDGENNIWTPNMEAQRNRAKVLGHEFGIEQEKKPIVTEPRTDAQREAVVNKQKVLGVEYNLPYEFTSKKEPLNVAQEEAMGNKKKILGSDDVKPLASIYKRDTCKRSGLTLNLKPFEETSSNIPGVTPNIGSITPGELFPRLDLETPTTADVPQEGAMTSDIFTPKSEDKDLEKRSDKEFLNSEGFNFSLIVDEDAVETEVIGDTNEVNDSPSKIQNYELLDTKYSLLNLLDGSYTLERFNPFGVKELKSFSKDHFSSKMELASSPASYTHPATIMDEMNKKPYMNIFVSNLSSDEKDNDKVKCDNIATLTACLQRSVMLPLTYQLEVVNNSTLTYFLQNLDMYEHLRSLKDYFFLMDGEFSRSICQNLFAKLTMTLNPQDLLNFATLHNILDKALGSSISHVHKFSENLSFTITESPLSFQHSSPDVLQCLSLTYTVGWPLNIILSQEALLRYAKVFQFLVKMRRVSWVLNENFEILKLSAKLSRECARKLQKSPHYISLQLYRHIMASMMRALDNYIVTTCILTSWNEFENDLKKARTLDDLYDCHVIYIKKVLFRCLLNNRSTPVMKLLNDIFTIILKFSRLLKAGDWQRKGPNGTFIHSSFSQLEELYYLFQKLAKYLHKVISKLMECGYQRHLVELITMFNLNGYYDTDKTKDNASVNQDVTGT